MFVKFSSCSVIGTSVQARGRVAARKALGSFEYDDRGDGYLYVSVRACTADVPNLNYDMLPHGELKTAYRTFVGKPVYVNHANTNLDRARGYIIDAVYHDEDPDDRWIEILMEMDEVTFPRLCALIRSGEIDTVSMGLNCESTTCSVCGNVAEQPAQFCNHIRQKGRMFDGVLAYEICNQIGFFEESWVYDPADPTATVQALESEARTAKTAAREFGPDNFYLQTEADFTEVGERPAGEPDYTSESGSEYWYSPSGVIRGSDHWGYGIGGCEWYLDGLSRQAYGDELYGYAAWSDFSNTRSYDLWLDRSVENVVDSYVESGASGTLEDHMFGELQWRRTDMNEEVYDEARSVLQVTAGKTAASGKWVDGSYGDGSRQLEVYDDDDTLFSGVIMPEDGEWAAWMTSPDNLMTYGDEMFATEDEAKRYIEEQARSEGFDVTADNMVNKLRIPEEVDMQNSDRVCPICGSPDFDGTYCDVCEYVEYAEGFGDIDTEEAQENKIERKELDEDDAPDEGTDDADERDEEDDGRIAARMFDLPEGVDESLLADEGYVVGLDYDLADDGRIASYSASLDGFMRGGAVVDYGKWL